MTIWQRARLNKGGASLALLGTFLVISPACEFSSGDGGAKMGAEMAAGAPGPLPGAGGAPSSSPGIAGSPGTGGTIPVGAGGAAGKGGMMAEAGSGGTSTPGVGGTPAVSGGTDARMASDSAPRVDAAAAVVDTAPLTNTAFPAGPYGFKVGETMANHTFTDRDGKPVSLGDLRDRAGTKVILWSSGAEWCSACKGEVGKLKGLHMTRAKDGLVVFESLHENANRTPANVDTLKRWDTMFNGISYLLAFEKSPPYANHANTNPYVWMINARTMKILSLETHAEGDVLAAVNAALAQVK